MKSSEFYQKVFEEVFDLLVKRECNTLGDFILLHDWLCGYPQGLSDGRYVYKHKFYNNRDELPLDGKIEADKSDELFMKQLLINAILNKPQARK